MRLAITLTLIVATFSTTVGQCPSYTNIRIFSDTGLNNAELSGTVTSFQGTLGFPNNMNNPGPLFQGFRQINWDANSSVAPFLQFDMPGDFFDVNVPRGAVFSAAGNMFAVSNPDDGSDDQFSSLVGIQQSQRFTTFSAPRLFTPVKSNVVTQTFKIPTLDQAAVVSGFGAIFTDVVNFGETTMSFYDTAGCLIVTLLVPTNPTALSFAGVIVFLNDKPWPVISRVVIKLGNVVISGGGYGGGDIVVLDDLIYGEPATAGSSSTAPPPY